MLILNSCIPNRDNNRPYSSPEKIILVSSIVLGIIFIIAGSLFLTHRFPQEFTSKISLACIVSEVPLLFTLYVLRSRELTPKVKQDPSIAPLQHGPPLNDSTTLLSPSDGTMLNTEDITRIRALPFCITATITRYALDSTIFKPRDFFNRVSIKSSMAFFSNQVGTTYRYLTNCHFLDEVEVIFLTELHTNMTDYRMNTLVCTTLAENGDTIWLEKNRDEVNTDHLNDMYLKLRDLSQGIQFNGWDDKPLNECEILVDYSIKVGTLIENLIDSNFSANNELFTECEKLITFYKDNKFLKTIDLNEIDRELKRRYHEETAKYITRVCFIFGCMIFQHLRILCKEPFAKRQLALVKALNENQDKQRKNFFIGGRDHFVTKNSIEAILDPSLQAKKYLVLYQDKVEQQADKRVHYTSFSNLPSVYTMNGCINLLCEKFEKIIKKIGSNPLDDMWAWRINRIIFESPPHNL